MSRSSDLDSDLDIDHAAHDPESDPHEPRRTDEHYESGAVQHGIEVAGVLRFESEHEEERDREQDVPRHPPFSRERLHLTSDLLTGPHEISQRVEDGSQTPTGGLLNPHRLDGPREVFDARALSHVLECDHEIGSDGNLGHYPVKLFGKRRLCIAPVHVDGALERLATLHRG